MEITLEQIEVVKDRTGVSYKEAKEALEATNGSVIDAIIYIEENIDASYTAKENKKVDELKAFVKDAVKKGNANRIKVYKGDEVLVNLPISAGIVGVVLFRWWGIIAAALATGVAGCRVELVKEDGSVIDITDKAADAFEVVKDKGEVLADEVVNGAGDIYEAAKAKGTDIYETVKDSAMEFLNKKNEAAEESSSPEMDASVIDLEEGKEKDE